MTSAVHDQAPRVAAAEAAAAEERRRDLVEICHAKWQRLVEQVARRDFLRRSRDLCVRHRQKLHAVAMWHELVFQFSQYRRRRHDRVTDRLAAEERENEKREAEAREVFLALMELKAHQSLVRAQADGRPNSCWAVVHATDQCSFPCQPCAASFTPAGHLPCLNSTML